MPQTWPGAAWSADDCRKALGAIVSSPHYAVPVVKLATLLGEEGAVKLASMNAKNVLLWRAYDALARDLDAAAFGPKRRVVYTLPSAAHVRAARIELDMEK